MERHPQVVTFNMSIMLSTPQIKEVVKLKEVQYICYSETSSISHILPDDPQEIILSPKLDKCVYLFLSQEC